MSQYVLDMHHTGLFVRRGIPADPYIINEVPTYAALAVGPDDTVLDLGANIGAMSHRFLSDGAKHVISVEPFPDNIDMLRRNLSSFDSSRYTILEAAVAGRESGQVMTLYTPDTNFGMISVMKHDIDYARLTGEIQVFTVKFDELVVQYQPTIIKCDVEGAEMNFVSDLVALPDSVKQLAIEWHNFEPHLEDQAMYDAHIYAHSTLIRHCGFSLISQSGELIPGQHSSLLCIYSRR